MGWIKRRPASPAYADSPERYILGLLADALNGLTSGWRIADADKGPLLVGVADNATVFLAPGRCGETDPGPGHLDLVLAYGLGRPEGATPVGDCVNVPGPDLETSLRRGIQTWTETTATAVLAAMGARTRLGAHFGPDDPFGVPGWHIVAGGVGGYGTGAGHEAMRAWLFENPPWPLLAAAFGDELDPAGTHAVKAFIGAGNGRVISEVRLDGEIHEEACEALGTSDWPRVRDVSVGRCFAMFVPAHGPAAVCGQCGSPLEPGPGA